MLADHRIGRVGQAEFLQSGPPRLVRQVVERGPGEEPVDDDLRQQGAIERRGNRLGEQARAARGNRDRRFRQAGVLEQGDLCASCGMRQRQELPGVQRLAFGLQPGLQRIGQRQIHVVAAEQDVFADADALQLQVAGDIGHRDQAEIGGAAADVAHQDDVARRHRIAPLPAGPRGPGIEGRLRFLQQRDVAQSGGLGRFGRQVSRDLVERSGHRHHDLAVADVPLPALGLSGVEEGALEVLQVEAGAIERRELLLCAIGPPRKRALLRIDVRVGQPGFGRRHQAIGHQGAMVAGELPDDPRLPAVVPGQLERPRPEFLRMRQVQRGGQGRLLAQLVGRQDLGDRHDFRSDRRRDRSAPSRSCWCRGRCRD